MSQPLPGGLPSPLAYETTSWTYARDLNHLNLLAIFHYIGGGMMMAFGSIFIIHIMLGIMMLRGRMPTPAPPAAPMPPELGWIFVSMGSIAVVLGWTLGILCIYSGRCLKRRRHWTFSIVIASVICLNVPIGTILGVFTLVVLLRDSVKALYGLAPPAPPAIGSWPIDGTQPR